MKLFFIIFSIILAISALLTCLLFLTRRYFGKPDKDIEYIHPNSFTFFTALYAFFLGFAIVTLWSAFLKTEANVAREADSLLITYRLSRDLPHSEAFRQALADYVRGVVQEEWPSMEGDTMNEETKKRFDNVWEQLHLLKPEDKGDNDLYVNLSTFLGEASQQRLSRALTMEGNLYPPIWVIIVFGFISVIYGLYFSHFRQNAVRIIFDFMVIFMVLSCIYFIYDINTPFSGYIVVKPEIFQRVQALMLNMP
jgi:hypothetical protein